MYREMDMFDQRKIFATDGEYFLYPIAEQDRKNYVELQRQQNGENTLFLNPRSKDMMWQMTLEGTVLNYSIFNSKGSYCGNVEIQNPSDEHPELGISLLEEMRNQGIGPKVIKLFAAACWKNRPVEYYLVKILSNNQHSRHIFEKLGAVIIGHEGNLYSSVIEELKKVFKSEPMDETKELMKHFYDEKDEEIIYHYKLDPRMFVET